MRRADPNYKDRKDNIYYPFTIKEKKIIYTNEYKEENFYKY